MPRYRVIIGQGTASQVYQFTGRQGDLETIVIGPEGLWGTLPEGHAMGQPPHLLTLPGQPVPAFQPASGKTGEGLKGFQDVKTFQGNVQQLAKTNNVSEMSKFKEAKVQKVEKDGALGYAVKVEYLGKVYTIGAEQVIFASGIGPQTTPEVAKITVKGTPDTSLPFKQMEEGIDYLAHADKIGQVVVVYGGAATGAWVAAEANAHLGEKGHWLWVSRSDFSKSTLPGDRNHKILAIEANQRKECSIEEAAYYAKGAFFTNADISWPPRPMIRLLLKKGGASTPFWCDQLIYCIGRNPGAEGSIADILGPLKDTLVPVRDKNCMVSDGNGVLAWGTADRSIMIVGSATFNFLGTAAKAQDAPMEMLPPNAQVADGIAVTVSTIEALNQYMPVEGYDTPREKWNINLNTSNRTQIAAEIARNTDLDPFTANMFVAMIIYMRSKNNFGLDTRSKQEGGKDHIGLILHEVKGFVELMRGSGSFDNARKIMERMYGVDYVLGSYIECMTESDVWKQFWKRNGLEC